MQSIKTVAPLIQQDPEWQAANASLEAKRQAAIQQLGEKWLLHPQNHIQKKPR